MLVMIGVGLLGRPSPAQAAFQLRIEDLTDVSVSTDNVGAIVTDGNATLDNLSAIPGALSFSGSVSSNFDAILSGGTTKPRLGLGGNPGSAFLAHMTFGTIEITARSAGSILFTIQDDGYTSVDSVLAAFNNIGGTFIPNSGTAASSGTTITVQGYVDGTNTPFVLGSDVAGGTVLGAITGNAGVELYADNVAGGLSGRTFSGSDFDALGEFEGSASGTTTTTGTFSMTVQVRIDFDRAGTVNFTGQQVVVPTPPAVWLALAAAPFLGLGYLRRRMRKQA
jgi:hypothetical protein